VAKFCPTIEQLIESLRCLPGVGPKSAQRMALHLLEHQKASAQQLANHITHALDTISHCEQCRMLTDKPRCDICENPGRQHTLLCVVQNPADVFAIEQTGHFRGRYFVLSGHISPLDGIGPDDIGIPELIQQCHTHPPQEIILATNPTVEGEATAQYISHQLAQTSITISRIAHGVPVGGELAYLDGNTLSRALNARQQVETYD